MRRITSLLAFLLVTPLDVAGAQEPTRIARVPAPDASGERGSPGARVAALVAFDSVRGRLLVYGGRLHGEGLDPLDADPRTYAWDGAAWSVIADAGPRSRDEIAGGIDPRDGSLVLVNGRGQGELGPAGPEGRRVRARLPFRETWRFDGTGWTLADTAGPEGGASPAAAWDAARGRLVMFGGAIGNDARGTLRVSTWEWDGTRWVRHDVPGPPARTGHVMAYDARARRVLLHGGVRVADRVPLTDTWAWNGERWRLLTMEGPRSVFGAATMHPDSGIVLFGGHRMGNMTDTTWHWTGTRWTALAAMGPAARTFHGMATDVRRRRVYLLGGLAGNGTPLAELWYLDVDRGWSRIGSP